MHLRFQALLVGLAVLLLVPPAASRAAVVAGSAEDRAGGVENPQQDVRSAAVVYDTGGGLRGVVTTAEPPTSAGLIGLGVSLGTWSKKRGLCSANADVDLRPPDPGEEDWIGGLFIGNDTHGLTAAIEPQGATIFFDVLADGTAGQTWNCAWAETFGPNNDPKTGDFKIDDETDVFSLTADEAQHPDAKPHCLAAQRRVARGGKVRLRCPHVTGPLTVRVYRDNKLKKAFRLKGRKVSTRGLRKGSWKVLIWRGSDVLGIFVVKVRR